MSGDGTGSTPLDSSIDSWLRPFAVAAPEPPPAPLLPGQRIGRYSIGRRIGRGATSMVFVASDTLLAREVALKVLLRPPRGPFDDFLREARSAARLQHPGLATVLDAGVEDGIRFIAFELVAGQSLRVLVNRARSGRPIERDYALALCEQIARSADAAHRAAIVHRDLKPENVALTSSGRAKILDFGLAAAIDSASGWAGTPGYAAPELGRVPADARSDQFALGVMLVELLTGSRPEEDARALEQLPAELCVIARTALATEPAHRFASCAAMADAIASVRERERRRARRRRAVPALCSLFLLFASPGNHSRTETSTPTAALPLRRPVVACPPLATAPGEEWLGAAAASSLCRRARAWLGGGDGVALPPAVLMQVAPGPASAGKNDPFAEPGMRARALAEADARADIVLTGSLARDGRVLTLSLVARSADGDDVNATASGPLPIAVATATDELFARVLPGSWPVDPTVTRFTDLDEQVELLALSDSTAAALSGAGLTWGLERAATLEQAPAVTLARSRMLDGLGLARADLLLPPIDGGRESYAGLGPAAIALGGPPSALTIATTLASQQPPSHDPGRATPLATEATAWLATGDTDRARSLATAAIAASPWDGPWDTLAVSSYAQPSFISVGRAYVAWQPDAADAWNIVAQDPASSAEERLEMFRRAHLLSDGFPLYAGNYGGWLVMLGQRDEARRLAADLALGSSAQRLAAARIATDIDIAEGAVGAAYERAKRALAEAPVIGSAERGDAVLFATFTDLAWLLGREQETAAFLYQTFVAPEPPRLDSGPFAAPRVAHACAHAAPAVALPCFERLEQLLAGGFFFTGTTPDVAPFVEGAAHLARGEKPAAARSMRRIREIGFGEGALMAEVFQAVGDSEAADRVDPPRRGLFNGVSLAHARAAERAANSGRCARARELADEVRRAWSRADVELPVVARLLASVERCRTARR